MAKNIFNSIKLSKPKRNHFDMTHDVKFSGRMGELIPTTVLECIPGDSYRLGSDSLIRFAPLIAPMMHRVNVTMHYFFVPNRLLWDKWEKWITQEDKVSAFPTINLNDFKGSGQALARLANYLGIPTQEITNDTPTTHVSAMPFAAYQMIYNEYYRDQNLIPEINYKLNDGENSNLALYDIRRRAWMHDYFTGSLPFAQKGDAVSIPIGEGNVEFVGNTDPSSSPAFVRKDGLGYPPNEGVVRQDTNGPSQRSLHVNTNGDPPVAYDPDGTLKVDMESTTINDLRRAFRLQEWLEKNARAGTRYVENILAHFGVRSSDKRLQRPEYITGTKQPVVISEVLNTTGEDGGLPQGNMAGHAISVGKGNVGSYFCEEHGYIIGIMSVTPVTAYMQGIPKHFLKTQDQFQYYWPSFAHIGEQEVENRELYLNHPNPDETFGYVPRYSEYKYIPSRVAGDFQSSLEYWHLARKFDNPPALNAAFIECEPSNRIFAVEDNIDNLYCHVLNRIHAKRPIPKWSNPGF